MIRYSMNEYHKAIYNIEMVNQGTSICTLGGIMRFNIPVNQDILIQASELFIRKNPALRIRIDKNSEMYISDDIQRVKIYNFSGSLDDNIKNLMYEPFELYNSPLYLIGIINISDSIFGFMKIHHILGDYSAMLVYFKQLEKFYNLIKAGKIPDITDDTRYIETMLAPDMGINREAKIYFKEKLKNTEKVFTGFGGKKTDFRADTYSYNIQADLSDKIIQFFKKERIRPESVFYAALAVYMYKTRGCDESIMGNVVMNRTRASINVFGLYANTIPLFIRVCDNFSDLCRNISNNIDEIIKYSSYPINCFLKDNGLKERCFDIAVSYVSMGMMPHIDMGEPQQYFSGYTEIPLRIHIFRSKKSISIRIEYMTALFSKKLIENFVRILMQIIECGIDGVMPEMLTKEDITAYKKLNNTIYTDCGDITVSKLFSAYAEKHRNDTAYIYDGKSVDFYETERMAGAIAMLVRGKHTAALVMGRCMYLIPAMLGVMKAGAAYMPVNPALEIPGCCDIILSVSKYNISGAVNLDNIDYSDIMSEDWSVPDKPAYYMRTSGSTGRPKTIVINNSSIYLRLKWMHDKYGLNKKILQKTNNTFDVSGWELLAPAFGGVSIIMKDDEEKDPQKIIEYIKKYQIEIIHFVPSALNVFLSVSDKIDEIKRIFLSGEALERETVCRIFKVFKNASVHNLYGPTECTIDVSYYDCTGFETEIPIGKPVSDTKLYVVNYCNEIMPRGVAGELVVTGGLVGAGCIEDNGGYINFNGERAYKTGDLCRLEFDGNLYFEGRIDNQVKINGKRIDLNGLYNMCMEIDGMENCAVIYENKKVYLFCKSNKSPEQISIYLSKKTDRLPSHIFCVDQFPLASSGKTDRSKLIALLKDKKSEKPENFTEQIIHDEIVSLLNKDDELYDSIDINENIFNTGINSLSVIFLAEQLKECGYKFEVHDFYEYPTIRMLASAALQPDRQESPLVYLKYGTKKYIICCFPYAGGHPYSFKGMSEMTDADIVAVNYSYFDESYNVENIAENIVLRLMKYEKIILVSVCIGSAFALETAYLLDKAGHGADEIYIIASLPSKTPNGINIWRKLPMDAVIGILSGKSGKEMPDNMPMENFLRDTDRYFKYMSGFKRDMREKITSKIYLAFGKKDAFTRGYKRKYKLWQKYFKEKLVVAEFYTGNHYFFEQTENLLEKIRGRKSD